MTPGQQQQQQPPAAYPPPAAAPQPVVASPPALQRQPANTSKKKISASLEDQVLVTGTPDEETEDGRVRNKEAVRKIRDTWIYKQVRARQDEFTQYRQVRFTRRDVVQLLLRVFRLNLVLIG